jgi:hypothetical protein
MIPGTSGLTASEKIGTGERDGAVVRVMPTEVGSDCKPVLASFDVAKSFEQTRLFVLQLCCLGGGWGAVR